MGLEDETGSSYFHFSGLSEISFEKFRLSMENGYFLSNVKT